MKRDKGYYILKSIKKIWSNLMLHIFFI
jgi:hypothetical protein